MRANLALRHYPNMPLNKQVGERYRLQESLEVNTFMQFYVRKQKRLLAMLKMQTNGKVLALGIEYLCKFL